MNDRHDAPAERSRDTERAPLTRRMLLRHAWRLGVALPMLSLLACARQPAGPVTPIARHVAHTLTLLPDGSLLVVGGIDRGPLAPVQRVVPATGQWFDAGQLREVDLFRINGPPTLRPMDGISEEGPSDGNQSPTPTGLALGVPRSRGGTRAGERAPAQPGRPRSGD